MKSYKVRAILDVYDNGKTEILYEIEPEVFVDEEVFVKWAKEKADVLDKEVTKAKTIGKKAKVKAFLKKLVEAKREKKESAKKETTPRARGLKNIRDDVEALRKRIKEATSYAEIIAIRKEIRETLRDKISLWGGEYGSSGEAQEVYEEIVEDLEDTMKSVSGQVEKAEHEKMIKKTQEYLAKVKARKEEEDSLYQKTVDEKLSRLASLSKDDLVFVLNGLLERKKKKLKGISQMKKDELKKAIEALK